MKKLSKAIRNELSQGQMYTPAPGQNLPGFYSGENPYIGGKVPVRKSETLNQQQYASEEQIALDKQISGKRAAVKPAPPSTQAVKKGKKNK